MNAEKESNRLPFRAGAMLLAAIAVVCIGLGIHQLTSGGDDPEAGLKAASESAAAAESATPTPSATTTTAASESSKPGAAADMPALCVLNAGRVTGLAGEVAKTLTDQGFTVEETSNLSTSSVSENTIFYTPDQEDAAKKVAEEVPGGAELNPRPDAFTRCLGQLAVVVVSR
ncbi:LytR C-terminal domain-containing protein [Gordonia hydrophobica]|uniref:LytR C-terminal domain-containing protein n=1 Tax=Gordonia hydrophobica TaxID=40516 RepID=A0ABZ2U409_9ACTN|nr:LytR C-terminal domain-containing protein [Gordonia hydrophobica]MBM7368058.1 cytoskeletal protein RodZ [Gordonia hydrophobica]